jgi:uncharacterized OsmC-like protein
MEVETLYLGDMKFEAITRGHRVICDQPQANGGVDAGMTPPELFLAALGTCAGFYAAQYLRVRSLPSNALSIKVTADKATQPTRLGHFQIEVRAPELDPHHEAGVLRAVKSCLIHNTLLHPPTIEILVNPVLDGSKDAGNDIKRLARVPDG